MFPWFPIIDADTPVVRQVAPAIVDVPEIARRARKRKPKLKTTSADKRPTNNPRRITGKRTASLKSRKSRD